MTNPVSRPMARGRSLAGMCVMCCMLVIARSASRLAPLKVATLGPGRVANNFTANPVDQPFTPSDVEAVEMYRSGEAPVEYGGSTSGPSSCVTLIWTK